MGIIDEVRKAVAKSIYMPDDELTVFATAIVAAHAAGLFDHAPRIMLSSEQGGFGKSQALRLVSYLTPFPWFIEGKAVSQPAMRAHLMRPERPTVILDEAAKVFGKSGRQGAQSPLYTMLTSGYDKEHTVSVSNAGIDEDASAYCLMFVGGLGTSLPEDALSRTIRLRMVKRPSQVSLTPVASQREVLELLIDPIASWVAENEQYIRDALSRLPYIHEALVDRTGEIWGPLIAIATADGPDELEALVRAFKRLGLGKPSETRTMDERILTAALELCGDDQAVLSRDLHRVISAWREFGGKTPRQLSMLMASFMSDAAPDGKQPGVVEIGSVRARGWHRAAIEHSLTRFVKSKPCPVIPDIYDEMIADLPITEVTEVTEVTDIRKQGKQTKETASC
jgi:hypothetical protein